MSKRAKRRAVVWRATQIIKATRGCQDCGYNKHSEALQFDHIDDNKKGNVSNLVRSDYGWETIKAEISKCEVVCANCHAIRSAQRREDVKNTNIKQQTLWDLWLHEWEKHVV